MFFVNADCCSCRPGLLRAALIFAKLKSRIFAFPRLVMKMLAGLKSR